MLDECVARLGSQVTPEFMRAQIEVGTKVCKSITEARADLAELRRTLVEITARYGCAPIGASFTLIALITGSLWGKPMWGTWWAWDARLTAELILLFLYIGFMALEASIEDPKRAARATAILALVGVINTPPPNISTRSPAACCPG